MEKQRKYIKCTETSFKIPNAKNFMIVIMTIMLDGGVGVRTAFKRALLKKIVFREEQYLIFKFRQQLIVCLCLFLQLLYSRLERDKTRFCCRFGIFQVFALLLQLVVLLHRGLQAVKCTHPQITWKMLQNVQLIFGQKKLPNQQRP